jgi:RNA polymerase subunit RPABC4/transcription elongation factor Spt4
MEPKKEEKVRADSKRKFIECRGCTKLIPLEITKCPYCGRLNQWGEFGEKTDKPLRKCVVCGHVGPMKTWLGDSFGGIIIAGVLLFCMAIPGIIFIAYFWGKYRCPKCKTIGKNAPFQPETVDPNLKRCPHCAEIIQRAAKICKHCGNQVINVLSPPPDPARPLPD